LEDTAAQIVEAPAGLAEETMERAVVLELGQLRGLDDARQGASAGTEDPSASHRPEGVETGPSEAGLKCEQEWSEGTGQKIGHQVSLSFIGNE
jgi:hypothetical protein